ncbi:serine carboxypeptidase, partial [bacterium]|nr:serine carboxypeptidase [bacterium]
ELYLVGPKPERLLTLSRQILSEYPSLAGRLKLSRHARDYLPLADIVLTTTSSLGAAVDVSLLRPGCLVCDVAVPPDIKAEEAAARDDILVIEAGEVRLPEGAELTFDFGLPPGIMYACLAETVLLALERRFGHFTLGRDIEPDRVRLIAEIAERHGFELASARSFGVEVPDEAFARLAAINRASRTQATAAHTAP